MRRSKADLSQDLGIMAKRVYQVWKGSNVSVANSVLTWTVLVFTPALPSSTTVVIVVAAGRALGCCLAYGGLSSFFHPFFFVSADWQMNSRSLRDFW